MDVPHSHELEEYKERVIGNVNAKPPSNLSGTRTQLVYLGLLGKIGTRGQRSLTGQDSKGQTLRKLLWSLEHF